MTAVLASAPGKVVLCGEYAVLDGAPAVAMAVDRRAQVTMKQFDGDWHRVSAPGHTPVEGRFAAGGNGCEWLQGGEPFGVVDAVWRSLRVIVNGHRSIELDTRAFVDATTGAKIGIGSSAALTAALAAALRESTDVLDDALAAHREFQQGSGSGVDVAAAVCGGLIEYRVQGPELVALTWPDGLAYRLIWSGVPVSTREQLKRLQDNDRAASRARLAAAAERMAEAWRSASAAAVLSEYPAYVEVLRQFGVDHDLGIFDAGHGRIAAAAAEAGLIYKPCGAGGGDVGILLGPREGLLDDFMKGEQGSELQQLECSLDADGIRVERV